MAKDTIKKAKNGTYYFRANLGYDSNGKQIQKYMSGFKTKKEALGEYSKLILYEEDDIKSVEINFKNYIDTIFIYWYKSQVTERTFLQRLNLVTKHFGYFDKFLVSEIQPIHVQRWQLKLLNKYSASYVRGIQGLFSMAMSRAVVLGICKDNTSKIVGNVAGVHRIKIHGLRHSHASLLISIGENPLVIKERLGHEDIETTLGTYGHLYPRSNFEVASKLKSAVSIKTSAINNDSDYSKFKHKNF